MLCLCGWLAARLLIASALVWLASGAVPLMGDSPRVSEEGEGTSAA